MMSSNGARSHVLAEVCHEPAVQENSCREGLLHLGLWIWLSQFDRVWVAQFDARRRAKVWDCSLFQTFQQVGRALCNSHLHQDQVNSSMGFDEEPPAWVYQGGDGNWLARPLCSLAGTGMAEIHPFTSTVNDENATGWGWPSTRAVFKKLAGCWSEHRFAARTSVIAVHFATSRNPCAAKRNTQKCFQSLCLASWAWISTNRAGLPVFLPVLTSQPVSRHGGVRVLKIRISKSCAGPSTV